MRMILAVHDQMRIIKIEIVCTGHTKLRAWCVFMYLRQKYCIQIIENNLNQIVQLCGRSAVSDGEDTDLEELCVVLLLLLADPDVLDRIPYDGISLGTDERVMLLADVLVVLAAQLATQLHVAAAMHDTALRLAPQIASLLENR